MGAERHFRPLLLHLGEGEFDNSHFQRLVLYDPGNVIGRCFLFIGSGCHRKEAHSRRRCRGRSNEANKEVYGSEWAAAKTPADKQTLAKKLVERPAQRRTIRQASSLC